MRSILIFFLSLMTYSTIFADGLDKTKTYTVAFAQDTLANDYRLNQMLETKKALSKYPNIRFIYSDAKTSSSIQVQQIEDFISMNVDLLIVSPFNDEATKNVIVKAYESNIPVILIERKVPGDKFTSYIHPDDKKIAKEAAEYIFKKINYKGTILLLKGVPKNDVEKARTDGFFKVANRYPDVKVIERTANYLRRDAIIELDKLLSSGKSFDAIMSQSDSMLVGARMALKRYNIDPSSIITVGIDYIKEAQEAIQKGEQNSSFIYSLGAKKSAEIAIRILSGESVEKEIKLETLQITKENVDNVKPIF
ncbi:MAG: substrate-binding domain-containing protein [Campylobacterota bacterium]